MKHTYRVRIIRTGSGVVQYTGAVRDLPGQYLDLASALAAAVDLYSAEAHRIEVREHGGRDVGEWDAERGASFIIHL